MLCSVSTATWLFVALVQFASKYVSVDACRRPVYGRYCQFRCGVNLTTTSGSIFSPGFDESIQYVGNEDCNWYIIPQNENSSVLIAFYSFATESCCHNLTIYTDPPTYSTFVARYRGNQLPYDKLYRGPLRLHFLSDGSSRSRGFKISYRIIDGIAPKFVSVASDMSVVKGGEVLLPCNVTGNPQPLVTWYKDGLDVHLILQSKFTFQGNNLHLERVAEVDSGFFKCKAKNYLNSTEQVLQLFVYVPPVIITHPTTIHFENVFQSNDDYDQYFGPSYYYYYNGLSAVFRCDVSGSPKPNVSWKKNGIILSNPTTKFDWLLLNNVNMSHEGNYNCIGNNSYGTAESRAASLTIGNVLPCCLSSIIENLHSVRLGTRKWLGVNFKYGTSALSNITVTRPSRDRQFPLTNEIVCNSKYGCYVYFGNAVDNDSGVYGFHLSLSNSINLTVITVSCYVPIFVQVPPRIAVTPPNVVIREFDQRLNITCSVYTLYASPTLYWFKNNTLIERHKIEGNGLVRSQLRVNNTSDDIDVKHYTCAVYTKFYMNHRTTVSVVVQVEQGGWSWWTDASLCSKTCGVVQGFRIRRRFCYSDSYRCPGRNVGVVSCYPLLRYCPSGDFNAIPTNATIGPRATLAFNWTVTATDIERTTPCGSCGQSVSVAAVAAIFCVVTITAIAITIVVTYWIVKRNEQKQKDNLHESVGGDGSVPSDHESPFRKRRIETVAADSSQSKDTRKRSVKYSNASEEIHQRVENSEHYTSVVRSESQKETIYQKPVVVLDNAPPISRATGRSTITRHTDKCDRSNAS